MQRKPIPIDPEVFPSIFRPLLSGAVVYDSSCSPEARVYFIDKDGGYFLKSAPKDALQTEAEMTRYFHRKGLSAEMLAHISEERDWMLTAQVPGEDCTHADYLADPKRLCDTTATLLRELHEHSFVDCPIPDRNAGYLETARRNHAKGVFDASLFPENWGYSSAKEAWDVVQKNAHLLKADTLLHGDYCLPNVMLENWRFSGFIDVGNGGIGDRHVDLFWGAWTLFFNLKTEKFTGRFLDAYGRDKIEPEMLRVVAAFEAFG